MKLHNVYSDWAIKLVKYIEMYSLLCVDFSSSTDNSTATAVPFPSLFTYSSVGLSFGDYK